MGDTTGDIDTAPRVTLVDGAVVLSGEGCNVAYTLDAALVLAHRIEEAVAKAAPANDGG